MRYTKNQQKAIDHWEGNLQIIACAGSGKTDSSCSKKKPSRENNIPVDNVLISKENQFYYFGCFAHNILADIQEYFKKGPNYKKNDDDEEILNLILDRIKEASPKPGIYGFPSFKKKLKKFVEMSRNENYLCEIYRDYFDKKTKKAFKHWKEKIENKEEFVNPVIDLINCF